MTLYKPDYTVRTVLTDLEVEGWRLKADKIGKKVAFQTKPPKLAWYVIQTKVNQESTVAARLGLLGIETFVPLMESQVLYFGRLTMRVQPLFPRYIFAKFDYPQHVDRVSRTVGIKGIICFDQRPAAISEEVIHFLKSRMNSKGIFSVRKKFQKNQTVRIKNGPFKDLTGVFIKELSGSDRVLILLKAIGFQSKVELHSALLEVV